ncbi:MAG TPA: hypothetical protein VGG74_18575 [Kofleriaceae bacterium]
MAVLPVALGEMDAVPPHLAYRVRSLVAALPAKGTALDAALLERLGRLEADGEPWFGAEPALAEVGAWMTESRHGMELRRRGCEWLAMFPTVDSVKRLAAIAADLQTPPPVREQAIRSLGDRELGAKHPSTRWQPEAVQLADEALVKLADAATSAGNVASEALPIAMRHVQWEGAFATFARAPGLWGAALECYASPALARVLLVCFEDIPAIHRGRAMRLVAATLGEGAVPMLLAREPRAALDDRLEILLLVVALVGESALGQLEDAVRGQPNADLVRARAKWHLQRRGVIPTIQALRVARATAVIAPADRERLCGGAADDLAAAVKFARYTEPFYYAQWAQLVRLSRDPARARELVVAHPESMRLVGELYLADLARRGKVAQLAEAARSLGAEDVGAMQLALWGRPLAALELSQAARRHTPELAYARVLACYRAGRVDLAERLVADDPPPAAPVDDSAIAGFPGANERWLVANAADARPALVALAGGLAVIAANGKPAPFDAEPDATSLEPFAHLARRVARSLAGATVYVAGELEYMAKSALAEKVAKVGARLVGAPYPGTDYYVRGNACPAEVIAELERHGARKLDEGAL